MRRNSTVKPALVKGTLQSSLQALQLKRVDGGMIIYTAGTAAELDKTYRGVAEPEWEDFTLCMRN